MDIHEEAPAPTDSQTDEVNTDSKALVTPRITPMDIHEEAPEPSDSQLDEVNTDSKALVTPRITPMDIHEEAPEPSDSQLDEVNTDSKALVTPRITPTDIHEEAPEPSDSQLYEKNFEAIEDSFKDIDESIRRSKEALYMKISDLIEKDECFEFEDEEEYFEDEVDTVCIYQAALPTLKPKFLCEIDINNCQSFQEFGFALKQKREELRSQPELNLRDDGDEPLSEEMEDLWPGFVLAFETMTVQKIWSKLSTKLLWNDFKSLLSRIVAYTFG